MAAPPPDTRFKKTDYPSTGLGTADALDKFFQPLNAFLTATRTALNGGLTIGQNSNAEYRAVTFSTPSTDWITVGGSGAPAFQNGWANFGSGWQVCSFKKDALGFVHLRGHLTGPSNQTVFQLPVGYRPATNFAEQLAGMANNAYGYVTIDTGFNVYLTITGGVGGTINFGSIAGVTFQCADFSPGVLSCFPLQVATSIKNPKAVKLCSIQDVTVGSTPIPTAVGGVDWSLLPNGKVQVNNIPGLVLGRTYSVVLEIGGG